MSEKKETGIVLYTDGGCIQERQCGGWAVHGYLFDPATAKQGSGCKKAKPTAQGYVKEHEGHGVTVLAYYDYFGSIVAECTNNIAELRAFISALDIVLEAAPATALIFLDSKYVLQGTTEWSRGWLKNGWKTASGEPVSNKELWEDVLAKVEAIKQSGTQLRLQWVKGHADHLGNEIADQLATLGSQAALSGLQVSEYKVSEAQGYWKSERNHSRLLNMPTWYFGVRAPADSVANDAAVYYMGSLKESVEYTGKSISDASFAVLYLKTPDPVLEYYRNEAIAKAANSFYGLAVGHLSKILKPQHYDLVNRYGVGFLRFDPSKNRWSTPDSSRDILLEELRPVRRAYYAVDRLQELETALRVFLEDSQQHFFHFSNITPILYEDVVGKKSITTRLKPGISITDRLLPVTAELINQKGELKKIEVSLQLGHDIPDRNTLAAIATTHPKVWLVTWPASDKALRYATIIETDEGVGIWAGVYSNLIFLPLNAQ